MTYGELEAAPAVLLVGFEPEEESPIVFLRLRKAARKRGQRLFAVAPWLTNGVRKAFGTLLATVPGDEPGAGRARHAGPGDAPVRCCRGAGDWPRAPAWPAATDVARAAAVGCRA